MQLRTIGALGAFVVVSSVAHAGIENTLEFEDLTIGDTFPTGTPFITEGVSVTTNEFFFLGGGSTISGFAQVINPNLAGADNGIFANNTNLAFGFAYPQGTIGFGYADQGGNANLTVNGTLFNVDSLASLDGTTIGDVLISVSPSGGGGADVGFVTLTGTISDFSVGGQEFSVDNVRYTVPAPGTLALAGLALVGARRRR